MDLDLPPRFSSSPSISLFTTIAYFYVCTLFIRSTTAQTCVALDVGPSYLPSCSNSFGCFWDLSRCSICQDDSCKCSSYNGCDVCKDMQYLDDSSCTDCPTGCTACCSRSLLTSLVCTACSTGYKLISGVCAPAEGCATFLSETNKCLTCIDGYYLDSTLKCQICNTSCSTCLTKSNCLKCKESTHIASSLFPGICINCNCTTD